MEFVPGVKQKLLSRRVPQLSNKLQGLVHEFVAQNTTFAVAIRQFVFGAERHAAPPLYRLHSPPHTGPARVEQATTMTFAAASVGPLTKVTFASVVESQVRISDSVASPPTVEGA